jgi:Fe-S oxidoreductase
MSAGAGDAGLARWTRRIDLCVYCPKLCRHVCPVAVEEGAETSTPWALMSLLGLVRDGLEAPSAEWGAALAHCTSCGRCQRACLHENDVTLPILEGRRIAWEAGVAPPEARALVDGFAAHAARAAARLAALTPVPAPGTVAYFPGCAAALGTPDDVPRTLAALERLGAHDVTLVGRDDPALACCGDALRSAGAAAAFAEHGRALAARLAGHRLVITGDPACADALRAIPDAAGVSLPPVRTAIEIAAELLGLEADAPDADDGARPVLLHQPCQALRDGAPAAAATAVAAAAGLAPAALPAGDRSSACCGARSCLPDTVPGTAAALARHLGGEAARERARRGLDAAPLVTSGARCAAHLRASGVEVRTLWELLESADPDPPR